MQQIVDLESELKQVQAQLEAEKSARMSTQALLDQVRTAAASGDKVGILQQVDKALQGKNEAEQKLATVQAEMVELRHAVEEERKVFTNKQRVFSKQTTELGKEKAMRSQLERMLNISGSNLETLSLGNTDGQANQPGRAPLPNLRGV